MMFKVLIGIAIIFSAQAMGQEAPPIVQATDANLPMGVADPNLQAQFQSELSKCEGKKKQAEKCCGDPMSCASGMSPQAQQQLMQLAAMGAMAVMSQMKTEDLGISKEGITGLCSMLSALGSAGSGVNDGAAKVCEETRSACSTACSSVLEQWKSRQTQCAGTCPDAQTLNMAVSELESRSSTCNSLQANTDSMKEQKSESGKGGGMGEFCSQIAGMLPEPEEAKLASQDTVIDCNLPEHEANPLCIDCKANPENKACGGVATEQKGALTYAAGAGIGEADFNTGAGIDGLTQDPKFGSFAPTANRSGTVSGSGGGIPGGGNDGGGFGSDAQGGGGEGEGYNTDVLNGERGGGGYTASAMGVDASGGFSGYGNIYDSGEEMPYQGMDLKKFLPGGDMDPSRRVAGALVNSGQINAQNTDIFQRVSARVKIVCSTNRLKDCQRK